MVESGAESDFENPQEEDDEENDVENQNTVELAIPDICPYCKTKSPSAAFQTPHNARVHFKTCKSKTEQATKENKKSLRKKNKNLISQKL